MEHIVNFHQLEKCKSHGHGTDFLCDFEGSILLWGKFAITGNREVATLKPNLVTFFNLH